MEVFETVLEIQTYLAMHKGKSLGFVPTMGALHDAHASLIEISKKQNDITICSIFVNPKQFNKEEDLVNYPRNRSQDLQKLEAAGCDVVFIPTVEEMYPVSVEKEFDFGILSEVMEAKHRPGHFNGVAIVIERFFEIINPNKAYFGEKDFQQLAVIRKLVEKINSTVTIVGCPTYRDANGLAMSSRNERLSPAEKNAASKISKALTFICQHKKTHSVKELKIYFMNEMSKNELFDPEYIEIAEANTLETIDNWGDAENYIVFTAVNVAGVRLIDNMTIIN